MNEKMFIELFEYFENRHNEELIQEIYDLKVMIMEIKRLMEKQVELTDELDDDIRF